MPEIPQGTGMAGQVNGLVCRLPQRGLECCLKVQGHELTFNVLIMPAGCGTLVLLDGEKKISLRGLQLLARFSKITGKGLS